MFLTNWRVEHLDYLSEMRDAENMGSGSLVGGVPRGADIFIAHQRG